MIAEAVVPKVQVGECAVEAQRISYCRGANVANHAPRKQEHAQLPVHCDAPAKSRTTAVSHRRAAQIDLLKSGVGGEGAPNHLPRRRLAQDRIG